MRTIALTFALFSFAASTSAAEIYNLKNKTAKAGKELTVTWFFNVEGEVTAVDTSSAS